MYSTPHANEDLMSALSWIATKNIVGNTMAIVFARPYFTSPLPITSLTVERSPTISYPPLSLIDISVKI